MLSDAELEQFNREGYLVVEDVIDEGTRQAVMAEYADLMDVLYDQWHTEYLRS